MDHHSVTESPAQSSGVQVGVEAIGDVVRRRRLRWYGYVQREGDADWVKGCTVMVVEGTVPAGRPKTTWQNCVSEDLRLL